MLVHPVPRHGHFSPRRRRGVISTSNLIYSEYGELMMLSLFNSNSNAELTQTIVATANRSTALSFRNAKSKLFFMLVAREVECDCYGALPLFLQCMSLFICQPRLFLSGSTESDGASFDQHVNSNFGIIFPSQLLIFLKTAVGCFLLSTYGRQIFCNTTVCNRVNQSQHIRDREQQIIVFGADLVRI